MNKWTHSAGFYRVFKRVTDVTLSLLFLIVLAPLMALIWVALMSQGDGPVIFRQERLGRNGALFQILKFRSMTTTAPSIAAKDIDAATYVTPLGRILRRTSLDELPQLINILKGEMSFVGPRPLIPNEGWINEKRKEMGIDKLRPGLTGWAQVKARDTEDQNEKLKLDLYYKDHKNILLDLKIIGMTALEVFHGK
ncbi:sugar transferase [Proteiniclasticum sp. SCR006]|uniref:Sugar transferase n=1 Tax=Proteiniclasticum aestuarii TaxID=2817862 RepID=A0A939KKL0_9CLOT|nr:sugar transferase [Proteiniclasticum aestuarii]MBO1266323.1 sugar transferase [Proteiniclasticum aestuarii]